jgi:hypothetical protein
MNCQYTISDEKLTNLSLHARTELDSAVQEFANDLIDESSRLEAANRGNQGSPEITGTTIKDAKTVLKRYHVKHKKSNAEILMSVLSDLLLVATALQFDIATMQKEPSRLEVFLLTLIGATVFTILKYSYGRNS